MVVSNTAAKLSRSKNHSQANVVFPGEAGIQLASSAGVGGIGCPLVTAPMAGNGGSICSAAKLSSNAVDQFSGHEEQ
jgi:hypothetical protein